MGHRDPESKQRARRFHAIVLGSVVVLVVLFAAIYVRRAVDERETPQSERSGQTDDLQGDRSSPEPSAVERARLRPEQARQAIAPTARATIQAIRDRDIARLAALVHPHAGVRFSPYAYVDSRRDIVLSSSKLVANWRSNQAFLWGAEDGTGAPLDLKIREYFDRFVYDADYVNAEKTGYNQTLGSGNTRNNASEIYPQSIIVEYHFSGFDPQYDGMDWRSLRLVFAEEDGQWYLVGIIHDEWTI